MKKIDGVESAEASLNRGSARIALKPGNRVRLEDLAQKVRDNGFTPKQSRVSVRGRLARTGGKLLLDVLGTGANYEITAQDPARQNELFGNIGKTLIIEGVVPATEGKGASFVIMMENFKIEGSNPQ